MNLKKGTWSNLQHEVDHYPLVSTQEVQALEKRAETYRDYPIELKAAVIAAIEQNGGNVLATSKLFNLPRDTVNYWWKHSDRFVELKQPSSLCLADKFENIANDYADSLAEHDQSIITARDKAAIATSAVQNMQLLRGLPTDISANTEKVELTVVLSQALADVIDVTPE